VDSVLLLGLGRLGRSVVALLVFVLAGEILVGVAHLPLLFLGLPLDFCEFVLVEAVEALMDKIALLVALTDFVEIVHVQLNKSRGTCLTKEE